MNADLLKGVLIHASLYGAYTILFTLSAYVHWKKRTSGFRIHLTFLSILFILATIAYIAILDDLFQFYKSMGRIEASFQNEFPDYTLGDVKQTWDMLLERFYRMRTLTPLATMVQAYTMTYERLPFEPRRPTQIVRVCYILANLLADIYITYRCYIVWGHSKKVAALPVLLIIVALVFQIGPGKAFSSYVNSGYGYTVAYFGGLAVTLVTNLFVTLLTAGRIWWIGRKASFLLQRRMQTKYDRTVQIVLESGLLYPITLLATILMLQFSGGNNLNSVIALNLCVVNIAPTLIIIRVGLGVSSDDMQTTIQTFKAAEVVQSDDNLPGI